MSLSQIKSNDTNSGLYIIYENCICRPESQISLKKTVQENIEFSVGANLQVNQHFLFSNLYLRESNIEVTLT